MKLRLVVLAMAIMLIGCGGKSDEKAKAEAALKVQADIAKAQLQEKADAMAKSAASAGDSKTAK